MEKSYLDILAEADTMGKSWHLCCNHTSICYKEVNGHVNRSEVWNKFSLNSFRGGSWKDYII